MAPRLIAPSPYAQVESSIGAVEAVALMAMGRFRGLQDLTGAHEGIPDLECVPTDADWEWQFAGAIWDWATTDSLHSLKSVRQGAPDCRGAAASGVLLACALRRQERHDQALAVLNTLAGCEAMEPVDRGWALIQRARIHTDLDDFDAARSDAIEAQHIFIADQDDPMVSALKASAAWTLYHTSNIHEGGAVSADPESDDEQEKDWREASRQLLVASDTTVSWWRSQHVALGLSREQDRSFESWTEDDPATHWGGGPMPETELFAAELNADLTGEHRTWREVSARRGLQTLMRAASSPDEVSELSTGLDALRRSGDSRRLTQAVKHSARVGPLLPLVTAMNNIPATGWTRTTALANLEVLALGGDLIDEASADKLLEGCARAACGETTDLGCTTGEGYISVPHYGTQAAAGLLPAASDAMHTRLARWLATLPEMPPAHFRRGLEQALNHLDYAVVQPADRAALRGLTERDDAQLSAAVNGWFEANGDPVALAVLKQAALEGDVHALSEITSDTAFSDQEAAVLIETLEQRVLQTHSEALAGRWYTGSPPSCYGLARCNLLFPNVARWQAVLDVFGEPSAYIGDKRAICDAISRLPQTLPPQVHAQLDSLVDFAEANFASVSPGSTPGGMALLLKNALGLIDGADLDAAATRLVFGSPLERRDASVVLRTADCSNRDLLLHVLAHDSAFAVRQSASRTVGYIVASGTTDAAGVLAWKIANGDGRELPLALIRGIAAAATSEHHPVASDIAELLAGHASAAIRRHAERLL